MTITEKDHPIFKRYSHLRDEREAVTRSLRELTVGKSGPVSPDDMEKLKYLMARDREIAEEFRKLNNSEEMTRLIGGS